ncbi:MAG TPA: hypothetical protein VNJ04_19675 [Gemmatimonadaceae bacterium]|nr:hypothetical protein [Gemmatimonadaceae bacterium]
MNRLTQTEPLLTVGSVVAVVSALLVFLQSFGIDISDDQQKSIRELVAVLSPVVLAFVARQFVFSPAGAQKIADEQYAAGRPPTQPQPDIPPPANV